MAKLRRTCPVPFVQGARRHSLVTCFLVIQGSWANLAHSQNQLDSSKAEPDVYIDLRVCQSTDQTPALYAAVLVELADQDMHVAAQASHELPGIELLDCELDDGVLSLQIQRAQGHETESNQINLSDVPTVARARTAAVALVEWLISLKNEQRTAEAATPTESSAHLSTDVQDSFSSASEPRPAAHQAIDPSSQARSFLTLETGAALTMVSPTLLLLPGAYFRADLPILASTHLELGAIYGHRASNSRLGRSTLDLLLVEGSVVYRPVPGDLLRLAVVAQWGHAWAHGTSTLDIAERTQTALLAILRFRLNLRVPVSQSWSVHGLADFGPVLHGAVFKAGGEPVFRLQTFAAETSFGVGFSL